MHLFLKLFLNKTLHISESSSVHHQLQYIIPLYTLSSVLILLASRQQTCMTYTIAARRVKNS